MGYPKVRVFSKDTCLPDAIHQLLFLMKPLRSAATLQRMVTFSMLITYGLIMLLCDSITEQL